MVVTNWNIIKNVATLFCLLVLVYFFILLDTMSESALEKLKRKERERELESKVEAFRREQVKKERMEHVKLTWTIYEEPLALCAPVAKETKFFEQEQKRRELKEELEVAFNFFKKTIISIISTSPQVIGILNLEGRLKFISTCC